MREVPETFSNNAVFSSCVLTIAVMICTPGSVTASMGPRATSTVAVSHRPDVLPASRARYRYLSAQSGTLILGGGQSALFADSARRSTLGEVGAAFSQDGKLFVNMRVQHSRHLARVAAKIRCDQRPYAGGPVQPRVPHAPEGLEDDTFSMGKFDQAPSLLFVIELVQKSQVVLLDSARLVHGHIHTSGQDDPFGSFGRRFLFADTGLDVRQCAAYAVTLAVT